MLRDRLICRCNNDHQLLTKSLSLNFEELAQAFKSAEQNAKDMQPSPLLVPVHAVKKGGRKQQQQYCTDCYRCVGKRLPNDCRFKEATCHFCKITGHIAKVCRSKAKRGQRKSKPSSGAQGNPRKTHQIVEQADQNQTLDTSYNLFHVNRTKSSRSDPMNITININEKDIVMEVDTGAHYSLISEST